MSFTCVRNVGKTGKRKKRILPIGGDMQTRKIKIDKNNYIKLLENGEFELHCRAHGPLGSNVYYFENRGGGYLRWKQRRSYSFVAKRQKVIFEDYE